jgi:hypothetical protein
VMETLIAFKRAGADGILTYFAFEAAKALQSGVTSPRPEKASSRSARRSGSRSRAAP